jgi:hypothetical protein
MASCSGDISNSGDISKGLGRRQFLKLSGGSAALAATTAATAVGRCDRTGSRGNQRTNQQAGRPAGLVAKRQ